MTDHREHIDEKRLQRTRMWATCLALALTMGLLAFLCWFGPKNAYSESERRNLADFPALTASSIGSGRFMSQFETYAQDAFPFREAFRRAKALASENLFFKMDNNGFYTAQVDATEGEGDPNAGKAEERTSIVSMEYPLDEASALRATERFRFVYETFLEGTSAKVYAAVIPDKNYYFAEATGHLAMDYARMFDLMAEGMPYASHLDITGALNGASYYLTDAHWRQESLIGIASLLLEGMSASPSSTGHPSVDTASDLTQATAAQAETADGQNYTEQVATDSFYGVYYGQAALPVQPDQLIYLTSAVTEAATAYDHQNNRAIPVYDLAAAQQGGAKDPYDLFLGGPLSLITVESPLASTDRELIMFRDSFASSLAPLLLESYAKITLIDIRYIQPTLLGEYVNFENADVLFLYSTSVLNNSETLR